MQPVQKVTDPHIYPNPLKSSLTAEEHSETKACVGIRVTGSMLIQSDQDLLFFIPTSPTSSVRRNQGHRAFRCKQVMLKHRASLASTSSVM